MLHFKIETDDQGIANRLALALQPPTDDFSPDDLLFLGPLAPTAETPQPEPSGTHYLCAEALPQSSRSEQVVRNYVLKATMEATGKPRGTVTEALIEIERHSEQTALQWVDGDRLATLLSLLRQLLV